VPKNGFFTSISYLCLKVRSLVFVPVAGVGMVTAILSAPLESGNPPNLLFGKDAALFDRKHTPV
jgi:hypothetical protein